MSRILIVEDEFDLRETLELFLTESGYEVESTHLIQNALEILAERSFDCVLLDLMLPDGDGADLLDHIRQHDRHHDTPVIIMSALKPIHPTEAQRQTPFLQKPFSFKTLQSALQDADVAPE